MEDKATSKITFNKWWEEEESV